MYVAPEVVTEHLPPEQLRHLASIIESPIVPSECHSLAKTKCVSIIAPETHEAYLFDKNPDKFKDGNSDGREIAFLHQNDDVNKEYQWTEESSAVLVKGCNGLLKFCHGARCKVEFVAAITALGKSPLGGFLHGDYDGVQLFIALDDWGPPSTIVLTDNPGCERVLEAICHLPNHLEDNALLEIAKKRSQQNMLDRLLERLGKSMEDVNSLFSGMSCSSIDDHKVKKLLAATYWMYETGKTDNIEDKYYTKHGNLLRLLPGKVQVQDASELDQNNIYFLESVPQFAATTFLGKIHGIPARERSRKILFVVGSCMDDSLDPAYDGAEDGGTSKNDTGAEEPPEEDAEEKDGGDGGYSGSQQVTPLFLLCHLYEHSILGNRSDAAMSAEADVLHLFFLELIYRQVRSLDGAGDPWYYINRSHDQAVCHAGLLMAMLESECQELEGTTLYHTCKGKRGNAQKNEQRIQKLRAKLRKCLLDEAKFWMRMTEEAQSCRRKIIKQKDEERDYKSMTEKDSVVVSWYNELEKMTTHSEGKRAAPS